MDAEDASPFLLQNIRLFRFVRCFVRKEPFTDEVGGFGIFSKLALANGYLLINYMGYEEKRVDISLNKNKKIEYLGKIKVARMLHQ